MQQFINAYELVSRKFINNKENIATLKEFYDPATPYINESFNEFYETHPFHWPIIDDDIQVKDVIKRLESENNKYNKNKKNMIKNYGKYVCDIFFFY